MAGLRYWDGIQWQPFQITAAGYAVVSHNPPPSPRDGTVWVQPIDPIVDLLSPDALTEESFWSWAGFGYGYPGLSFTAEGGGMRLAWNPAPAQAPAAGQLGVAPFTGNIYDDHQLLVQMTVNVPAGSPDVRLTHAFTSSGPWITAKDQDVTVSLPILWASSMPRIIGPESTPAPAGGSVLVKDIHVYDLTVSPPSPLRVWSTTLGVWLPINDGLVQRAGDRMVGDLRFDTIDSANEQPTVTGLPTPTDSTDAVPFGFLTDSLDALGPKYVSTQGDTINGPLNFVQDPGDPVPATVTGLPDPVDDTDAVPLAYLMDLLASIGTGGGGGSTGLIVSTTTPTGAHVTGQAWINPSVPITYPEFFEFLWGTTVAYAQNVNNSLILWSKCRWVAPADGVLKWDLHITLSATAITDAYILMFANGTQQSSNTLMRVPASQWMTAHISGLLSVAKGVAYELLPGILAPSSGGSAQSAVLVGAFQPDVAMARVVG
ncbi:MAG: hypothetical protein ACOYB3_01765 [Azonexus sp.]